MALLHTFRPAGATFSVSFFNMKLLLESVPCVPTSQLPKSFERVPGFWVDPFSTVLQFFNEFVEFFIRENSKRGYVLFGVEDDNEVLSVGCCFNMVCGVAREMQVYAPFSVR